jgi:hypothetical protein
MSRMLTLKFAHGCPGKIRYASKAEAEAALKAWHGFARKRGGPRRQAYPCKFCEGYHNGRTVLR